MIRLTFSLPDGPHVLSEPELVKRHFERIGKDGKLVPDSVEHMASYVVRQATRDDIEQWRKQGV